MEHCFGGSNGEAESRRSLVRDRKRIRGSQREDGPKISSDKAAREESEKPKEAGMEVDGEVPQEESVEIQSPKRNVIRVESEETQDCVRDTLAVSQEEAEEMGFGQSALSEPRGTM